MKENKIGTDRFQDCCKNWSFNPVFHGCKKGCYGDYVIQSSNHQKLIEEKIKLVKHFCILCYNKNVKF